MGGQYLQYNMFSIKFKSLPYDPHLTLALKNIPNNSGIHFLLLDIETSGCHCDCNLKLFHQL